MSTYMISSHPISGTNNVMHTLNYNCSTTLLELSLYQNIPD